MQQGCEVKSAYCFLMDVLDNGSSRGLVDIISMGVGLWIKWALISSCKAEHFNRHLHLVPGLFQDWPLKFSSKQVDVCVDTK